MFQCPKKWLKEQKKWHLRFIDFCKSSQLFTADEASQVHPLPGRYGNSNSRPLGSSNCDHFGRCFSASDLCQLHRRFCILDCKSCEPDHYFLSTGAWDILAKTIFKWWFVHHILTAVSMFGGPQKSLRFRFQVQREWYLPFEWVRSGHEI